MQKTNYKVIHVFDGQKDAKTVLVDFITEKYIKELKKSVVNLQGKEYNLDKVHEKNLSGLCG